MSDDKLNRIVQARMKLRARFNERMQSTPALSDSAPKGTGDTNRHGMPQLPIGQYETTKWPVLDLGQKPQVDKAKWQLRIDGACDEPVCLGWDDFMSLEQVVDVSDFHCVTTWSRMDLEWRGVRVSDLLALAAPRENAEFLMCHAYDGYTTNVTMIEARSRVTPPVGRVGRPVRLCYRRRPRRSRADPFGTGRRGLIPRDRVRRRRSIGRPIRRGILVRTDRRVPHRRLEPRRGRRPAPFSGVAHE